MRSVDIQLVAGERHAILEEESAELASSSMLQKGTCINDAASYPARCTWNSILQL
jgi:hypothetical protein